MTTKTKTKTKTATKRKPPTQSADIKRLVERVNELERDAGAGVEQQAAGAFAGWPSKGYTGEQPWEQEDPPLQPRAGLPHLTLGSRGEHDEVTDLGRRLAELGYESSVTRGENPYGVLDATVMAAVQGFRRDYGVREDPSQYPNDPVNNAESHLGPWTHEAILRVSDRERATA